MAKAGANTDSYKAGLKLARAGRHGEAISCFEASLEQQPNDVRTLFALANTAEAIGHIDAAENFFRRVLAQEPDRLEALVNLANLLRTQGKTAATIALLRPAIQRKPHVAELWLTLGSAMREAADAKNAEIFYREALWLQPDCAAAMGNLADLLADEGNLSEALRLYDQAIATQPDNAQAHLNRAFLYFLKGDLENGWRDYEYRLAIKKRELVPSHRLPRWNGEISAIKLAVTAEQGLGDQIMFASLIPELSQALARAGGSLNLEAEPRLVPLFARSFATIAVHASRVESKGGRKHTRQDWLKAAGGADAAIELGSVPRVLRPNFENFPRTAAYLTPDPAEKTHHRTWLNGAAKGPFIGLCWRSSQLGGLRNLQYAPLEVWAKFAASLEGVPVSLQYDASAEEIQTLTKASGRTILVPPELDQKQEVDRTAGMIAALDAVVSAPTSVAWIAAAVGVPTLKLLYNTSWTSFGKDYEPFAPQCRLMMPKTSGDWPDTFAKAAAALSSLLRPRA